MIRAILFTTLLSGCYQATNHDMDQALLEHESKIPIRHICDNNPCPNKENIYITMKVWEHRF